MEKEKQNKKTLLHGWHIAHSANMAVFGGYEMPLWYPSGIKGEHLAVLTGAGLFDTSHMAVLALKGAGTFDMLQRCFTRDLRACVGSAKKPLTPGNCVYGAFLNEQGETVDDTIVYQLERDSYMVVVNACMGAAVAVHLLAHRGKDEVEIVDLSDKLGKLDIQGPHAARILGKILAEPGRVFDRMGYFTFRGHFDPGSPLAQAVQLLDGTPILLSRTGYTGEFGFEIFVAPSRFVPLWDMLLEAGAELGLIACGLGARDSLRAGAVLPLSHQDIGHWPFIDHPWPFALPFNDDLTAFTKDFIGAEALLSLKSREFTYPFVGNDLRKVSTEPTAAVVDAKGVEIGTVLTCATDMGIGWQNGRIFSIASPDKPEGFNPGGLSCGFIKVKTKLAVGDTVELRDKRRGLKVTIVNDIRPDRTARSPIREML